MLSTNKPSDSKEYLNAMNIAKENMQKSLAILSNDEKAIKEMSFECKNKFINLSLNQSSANKEYKCFEDLWSHIKKIFDWVISYGGSTDESTYIQYKHQFKSILIELLDLGLPLIYHKRLSFWTTLFAFNKAEEDSKSNQSITDVVAQSYLRKIFIVNPAERIKIFFDMVIGDTEPSYPKLADFFWRIFSELYIERIPNEISGIETHYFFQDSLTIGSIFWNIELPMLRRKNFPIIMHKYNLEKHQWENPILLDAQQSNQVTIRRRYVHKFDTEFKLENGKQVTLFGGQKIWARKFKNENTQSELIEWWAPKLLTIGKLKKLSKKWKNYVKKPKEIGCCKGGGKITCRL